MNKALNRKRSRLALESDDEVQPRREPSPALSTLSDTLKRSKTQCELDELDITNPEEAWKIDVDTLLASNTLATPTTGRWEARNNRERYKKGESMFVLCVQGNVQLHYDLLCSALPDLYTLSPSLQAFVLCHDPSTHIISSTASLSLPMIQAVTPSNNHFVRLGLLHPIGGGKFPLDALVILDRKGRRRLVLPFGWGAGKHADTPAGRSIQTRLMGLLRSGVETLEAEQ
ncbi:uncharacterized protein K460DRAFT_282027 [Cucurbitaria berberidis CBS 394.84]|uniref:Uncharacterized protein n=1 Tax=Cucurbitaria berberidis CBS 394.84 TaxID=1168544 RepID=A0A9P4GGQ6_9PLEO|nr:uncharacterized protein K460DRAFT_282027 [Cucurbitaria berberidis CBS 394.84]KAF1845793.1 hypothetical protein K460DRAFT_282027 [Cucurbitaria berberidis CBS 394.84]